MTRTGRASPQRHRMSLRTIALLVHCAAWFMTMTVAAVTSDDHLPPSELWTVLPLGISAIMVAFYDSRRHEERSPPPRREQPEEQ